MIELGGMQYLDINEYDDESIELDELDFDSLNELLTVESTLPDEDSRRVTRRIKQEINDLNAEALLYEDA